MIQTDAIIFIGPQGSGKGTQAKILSEKLGFFYWEMGGILREYSQQDTQEGKTIKGLIEKGFLVPDDMLLSVMDKKLHMIQGIKGVIFDGVPRRMMQAEFLISHLKEIGKSKIATIFLDVEREESIQRLLKRASVEGRPDDTHETIEFRLKQYEEETIPVLDYLKTTTQFLDINGNPPIETVTQEIDSAMGLIKK